MKKVHFMGIGGSGMNAVAGIAHAMGYEVTGCDFMGKPNEYTDELERMNIPLVWEHSEEHLNGIDILCVTPAVFDLSNQHPEFVKAKERGIAVMTWQEFMGTYLQKEKEVIAVAGTKGKSTTTSLIGVLLEKAGLDPIVEVGAKVLDWDKNYRLGQGTYFVCEADEFNNNFLYYKPQIAVITNIEMDHPEFFKSEEEYFQAFESFARLLPHDGVLIVNTDSLGVQTLLTRLGTVSFKVIEVSSNQALPEVTADGLLGNYNAPNIRATLALASELGIASDVVQDLLSSFKGVGRRFELICDKRGIKVFNDYAHNPMSVKAVLDSARMKFPNARIWAVFQPHMYTRTKMFLSDYAKAFDSANEVIVLEIFASREKGLPVANEVDSQMLVDQIYNANPQVHVRSIPEKEKAVEVLLDELKEGDVVVNMGAGDNGIIVEQLAQKL